MQYALPNSIKEQFERGRLAILERGRAAIFSQLSAAGAEAFPGDAGGEGAERLLRGVTLWRGEGGEDVGVARGGQYEGEVEGHSRRASAAAAEVTAAAVTAAAALGVEGVVSAEAAAAAAAEVATAAVTAAASAVEAVELPHRIVGVP